MTRVHTRVVQNVDVRCLVFTGEYTSAGTPCDKGLTEKLELCNPLFCGLDKQSPCYSKQSAGLAVICDDGNLWDTAENKCHKDVCGSEGEAPCAGK